MEEAEADLPEPVVVIAEELEPVVVIAEEPEPAQEVVDDTAGIVVEVIAAVAAAHMGCNPGVPEAELVEQHWHWCALRAAEEEPGLFWKEEEREHSGSWQVAGVEQHLLLETEEASWRRCLWPGAPAGLHSVEEGKV